MQRQLRALFTHGDHLIHLRKIELWVDALAVQIHCHGHDVHIAGALTVA